MFSAEVPSSNVNGAVESSEWLRKINPIRSTTTGIKKISRSAYFWAGVLILLQILDGVLTLIGVSRFGVAIEGNPFLHHLMLHVGHVVAVILVKTLAICVVFALALATPIVPWVTRALQLIVVIYMCAAVLPWIYVLS